MATAVTNPMIDGFPSDYVNPRKIPKANFIENVEGYAKQQLGKDNDLTDVSVLVKKLQQQRDQYDLMERRALHRKENLKKKVPEITKTLTAVEFLKKKREDEETANVMVEYTFDEARDLLTKNLDMAKQMLDEVTEDLAYIKDQKTTTEVNISRMHNFGVKMRAKARAAQTQK